MAPAYYATVVLLVAAIGVQLMAETAFRPLDGSPCVDEAAGAGEGQHGGVHRQWD